MRKLNLVSGLIVVLFFVSTVANATGFDAKFKNYKIEEVTSLDVSNSAQHSWTISYGEQQEPVVVTKHKAGKGFEYVVTSKHFQVSYVVTNKGFGAKATKNAWRTVPYEILQAVINADELNNQKILSPNKVDDQTALGLIANYLPQLINDNYKCVLVN